GNIAAARATTRAAERRGDLLGLTARQEINAALTQHHAARRSLDIYQRGGRDGAPRDLHPVPPGGQLGRGSLLDVIAEQGRYIEIENGYTEALKQVYDTAVEIERVVAITR